MEKHKNSDAELDRLPSKLNSLDKRQINAWKTSERRIWVVTLFTGTMVLYAARIAMPVCATAMAQEFSWSKERLGTVMGCFFWGYASTQVLGGYIADRVGGDKVLRYAGLTWSIVTFVTPCVTYLYADPFTTLILLAAFRVILGFSQGLHYPSMSSLLSFNVRESERSLSMGAVSAGANLGSVLSGGIGSLILDSSHGWRGVFYFIGICALVWTLLVWRLSESQQRKNSSALMPHIKANPIPWKQILSKPPVWCLIVGQFCNSASFYILLMWLPTFYKERFPNEKAWVFNVVPWLMSIPASVYGGWLSDCIVKAKMSVTFTRKFIQTIAMLGCGVFAMILPHCDQFYIALLVTGMAVSCQTFNNSAILVNPQDIAPMCSGPVFGIVNMAGAIPGFIGVYVAGFILDSSGSWTTVFNYVLLTEVIGLSIFIAGATAKRVI